jgi:chemotaxis signal transduction protein
MTGSDRELKCLVLPIRGTGIVVPNTAVAEVITQQVVTRREDTPDWFLGTGAWRGREIPLIAFDRMCGLRDDAPPAAGRYVVLFALDNTAVPAYYGVRIEALPRSETVNDERFEARERESVDPEFIAARGRIGDRDCVIPDLDAVVRDTAAVDRAWGPSPSRPISHRSCRGTK